MDGWTLRYTAQALTRRANSAYLSGDWRGTETDSLIDRVEAFYTALGRLSRFQVSPTAARHGFDRILQDRGYETEAPVLVQGVRCHDLMTTGERHDKVVITDNLSPSWRKVYTRTITDPEDARGRLDIIGRIGAARALACIDHQGEPVSIGLGVLDEGWCGLFCMHTVPEFRRTGNADGILRAIANWAMRRSGHSLYLQVEEDNTGARAFYESRGFTTIYGYHYRTLGAIP